MNLLLAGIFKVCGLHFECEDTPDFVLCGSLLLEQYAYLTCQELYILVMHCVMYLRHFYVTSGI